MKKETTIDLISIRFSQTDINPILAKIFNELSSQIPDPVATNKKTPGNEAQIKELLDRYWVSDHSIIKSIMPCVILSENTPSESFNNFFLNLPIVQYDGKIAKTEGKTVYTDMLKGFDWGSPKHKLILLSINLMTIAYFLSTLITDISRISKIEAGKLFVRIYRLIFDDVPEVYHSAFYTPSKNLVGSISRLSAFTGKYAFKYFYDNYITNFQLFDSMKLESSLILFSEIQLGSSLTTNEFEMIDSLIGKFISIKLIKTSPILDILVKCIFNLIGFGVMGNKDFEKSPCLKKVKKFLKEVLKISIKDNVLGLFTFIYFVQNDSSKIPLMKFVNKYFKPLVGKPQYAKCLVDSYIILLRGKNYLPPSQLRKTNENFKWRMPKEIKTPEFRQFILHSIFEAPDCFKDCQKELSEFFLQYASDPDSGFARDVLPKFSTNEFKLNNIESIIRTIKLILLSSVQKNNEKSFGFQDQVISLATQFSISILKKELEDSDNDSITPFQVGLSDDILQSLRLYHYNIYEVIINNIKSSVPALVPQPVPKFLIPLSRWKKYEFQIYDFVKYDKSIELITTSNINSKTILQGISLISLIPFKEEIIPSLCDIIKSKDNVISNLASRILQILIYRDISIIKIIVNTIYYKVIGSVFYPHILYRFLNFVEKQIMISKFLEPNFEEIEPTKLITMIVIGLCSSDFKIRIIAYNVAQLIDHSLIFDFIAENDMLIGEIAKKKLLNGYCSSADKIESCQTIPFKDVIFSTYNDLYLYYISAFSSLLPNNETFLTVTKEILKIIERNKSIKNEYINSFLNIFCINKSEDISFSKLRKIHEELINESVMKDKNINAKVSEVIFTGLSKTTILKITEEFDFNQEYNKEFYLSLLVSIRNILLEPDSFDMKDPIIQFSYNLINHILNSRSKLEINPSNTDKVIKLISNNLILISLKIFKLFYEQNISILNGPYLKIPTCLLKLENFNTDDWFSFLLEYYMENDIAKLCFGYLLSITEPSSNKIFEKLNKMELSPIVQTKFLGRYYRKLLPQYIQYSVQGKCEYFNSIINLFMKIDSPKQFISEIKKKKLILDNLNEKIFTTTTFYETGSLIAISLFNLTDLTQAKIQDVFSFLMNIIFSSAIILKDSDSLKILFKKFNRIEIIQNKDFSELFFDVIIELSTTLSQTHAFCSEQFVYQMLQIINHNKDSNKLISFVIPWIKSVNLNYNTQLILKKTIPQFATFNFIKFMESLSNIPNPSKIIDIILQTNEITNNILEIIMTYFIYEHFNYQSTHSLMIKFLLSTRGKKAAKILVQFLKFSSWMYFRIFESLAFQKYNNNSNHSIKSAASMYNFNAFNNIGSIEKVAYTKILPSSNDPSFNYYVPLIKFLLVIIFKQFEEDPSVFKDDYHYLLSFSLVNYSAYKQVNQILSWRFPSYKITHKIENESLISYISTLNPQKQLEFGRELLEWGTMCGKLNEATRGLKYFAYVLYPANNDVIHAIINSSTDALLSLSGVSKRKEENKVLVDYISQAISVITLIVKKIDNPTIDVVSFAINCCNFQKHSIGNESLILINECLKHHNLSLEIKKSNINGFVNILSKIKFALESPKIVYEILCNAILSNNYKFIADNDASPYILALLLLPMRRIFNDLSSGIMKTLSKHLEIESIESKLINNDLENDGFELLSDKVGINELKTVLSILNKFKANDINFSFVYTYFTKLLDKDSIPVEFYLKLVHIASDDKEEENSFAVYHFLTKFTEKAAILNKGEEKNKSTSKHSKKHHGINKITEKLIKSPQLFKKDNYLNDENDFLPLSIIDEPFSFTNTSIQNKKIIETVHIQPFSNWYYNLALEKDAILPQAHKSELSDLHDFKPDFDNMFINVNKK